MTHSQPHQGDVPGSSRCAHMKARLPDGATAVKGPSKGPNSPVTKKGETKKGQQPPGVSANPETGARPTHQLDLTEPPRETGLSAGRSGGYPGPTPSSPSSAGSCYRIHLEGDQEG